MQKSYWNKLQDNLISKFSEGSTSLPYTEGGRGTHLPHPIGPLLLQQDSAPATLKFPPATFSQFEDPVLCE